MSTAKVWEEGTCCWGQGRRFLVLTLWLSASFLFSKNDYHHHSISLLSLPSSLSLAHTIVTRKQVNEKPTTKVQVARKTAENVTRKQTHSFWAGVWGWSSCTSGISLSSNFPKVAIARQERGKDGRTGSFLGNVASETSVLFSGAQKDTNRT